MMSHDDHPQNSLYVEIYFNIDVNFGINIYPWLLININWCKPDIFGEWLLS